MATWVIGDVHGCYNEFLKLIHNEEIKDTDTIILIGDIIDRGPDSYKMLQWAMENITDDGKYQMICGNHEDNIIYEYASAMHRVTSAEAPIELLNSQYDFDTYMQDYGFDTLGSIQPFVEWFKQLPLVKHVEVTTPNGELKKYVIAHGWYKSDGNISRDSILWDRDTDYFGRLMHDYDGTDEVLVHGHTPTLSIAECCEKEENEVLFREHSINIDCGCVFEEDGGNLAAIRLEDLKVIYARPKTKMPKGIV